MYCLLHSRVGKSRLGRKSNASVDRAVHGHFAGTVSETRFKFSSARQDVNLRLRITSVARSGPDDRHNLGNPHPEKLSAKRTLRFYSKRRNGLSIPLSHTQSSASPPSTRSNLEDRSPKGRMMAKAEAMLRRGKFTKEPAMILAFLRDNRKALAIGAAVGFVLGLMF